MKGSLKILGWFVFAVGCALVLAGFGSGVTAVTELDMLGSIWYLLSGVAFAFLSSILLRYALTNN